MKLFKLEQHNKSGWDIYCAAIIRAKDESSARKLASKELSPANGDWQDITKVSCTEIKKTGKKDVILSDFKAG